MQTTHKPANATHAYLLALVAYYEGFSADMMDGARALAAAEKALENEVSPCKTVGLLGNLRAMNLPGWTMERASAYRKGLDGAYHAAKEQALDFCLDDEDIVAARALAKYVTDYLSRQEFTPRYAASYCSMLGQMLRREASGWDQVSLDACLDGLLDAEYAAYSPDEREADAYEEFDIDEFGVVTVGYEDQQSYAADVRQAFGI